MPSPTPNRKLVTPHVPQLDHISNVDHDPVHLYGEEKPAPPAETNTKAQTTTPYVPQLDHISYVDHDPTHLYEAEKPVPATETNVKAPVEVQVDDHASKSGRASSLTQTLLDAVGMELPGWW